VAAAQHEEGVVGEAGVVDAEQADGAIDDQAIDEAHDDVRVALQRTPDGPELVIDRRGIARRGVHEADAGQAVQVVVDGVHVGADRTRASGELAP
jgi:hypothetical protein